jgi:hypothetical protein
VQKFSAAGLPMGAMVKLDGPGYDSQPQVSAVGSYGKYVVTWNGLDSNSIGENSSTVGSVFVQKFNADGTVLGDRVALEALNVANGLNASPQVSAVGADGAFVVTWVGQDAINAGDKTIFVKPFNNSGQPMGFTLVLEATDVSNRDDVTPQITSIDNIGTCVVTWSGAGPGGDIVYVQQFSTLTALNLPAPVALRFATTSTNVVNQTPQVTPVGSEGAYVVTWSGAEMNAYSNVFVQKFSANGLTMGAMVKLESNETTAGNDYAPQVTAVGSTGAYVVTWFGADAAGSAVDSLGPIVDFSIYVQKFNADGTTTGHAQVKLEAIQSTLGSDVYPQITAVGSGEDFVVTWQGSDVSRVSHVFAQKFDSSGTVAGVTAQLVALDNPAGPDTLPQVAAVGSSGAYAITWQGKDAQGGDDSIFVQQFYANGTPYDNPAISALGSAKVLSTELGTAYLVNSNVVVTNLTDITNAADNRWNQVAISQVNTPTEISATGLLSGSYKLYAADAAGNISAAVAQQVTVDAVAPTAQVQLVKPAVQLEAIGQTVSSDMIPQVSAVGSAGAYVVTWYGIDSGGDWSIFVQQFNANGTTMGHPPVQLEATGKTDGFDMSPRVSALGGDGTYVITWFGTDSGNKYSIFVQQFNADGTTTGHVPVRLDAIGKTDGDDKSAQVCAVGSAGAYVVTWSGMDSAGDLSIFVQKFNANGTITGNVPVQLEAIGVPAGEDLTPQISTVGSAGAFVVTWSGSDTSGDKSIFVQKFNADGTITGNTPVQLEARNMTTGTDAVPQVTAVGSDGAYVVTWSGQDSGIDFSIFVQKFNANGTTTGYQLVQLEALDNPEGADSAPQVLAFGTAGEYMVTWSGVDTAGDTSIFVQRFNADGGTTPYPLEQLEAIGRTNGADTQPQISAVGDQGHFVVTWTGLDSSGYDTSIFVQRFDASGHFLSYAPVQLEAIGVPRGADTDPQVSAVGIDGAYVVTWQGMDSNGDQSIFVQQFNADGTINNPTLLNAAATVNVQSTEAGTAYLVNAGLTVSNLASITGAADSQWNQVALPSANSDTPLATTGLADGSYRVYTADAVGNLSAPDAKTFVVDATAPTVSAIAITSATGVQDAAFNAGDVLSVTVTLSEATTVTGAPQLGLNIGATTVQAQYVSGSGSNSLLFKYTLLGSQSDSNGVSINASSLTLNGAKLVDAAGNAAVLSHAVVADNASYAVLDITAPLTSGANSIVSSNGYASVKSTEVGMAYLVRDSMAVSHLSDITGAGDTLWNQVAITVPNTFTMMSVAGLEVGVYKTYTADASGNLSAVSDFTTLVTNTADTSIQLTGNKLIAPLEVDGKWYAFWDTTNSGSANAPVLGFGGDVKNHNQLDVIFKNASDLTTVNPTWTGVAAAVGNNTTDTYRFATDNSVKLALPTSTELDALISAGLPADWVRTAGYAYWSSTPNSGTEHMAVSVSGVVDNFTDTLNGYVALQIL